MAGQGIGFVFPIGKHFATIAEASRATTRRASRSNLKERPG